MKQTIYSYTDYKQLLNDIIESYPNKGRGQRKQLSEAIGCQVAYITHVLSGDSDFSSEQIEAAARYFHLSEAETKYIVILLQHNRAGTKSLKSLYEKLLQEHRQTQEVLKDRLKIRATLKERDQAIYYSDWRYAAIHMAVTVKELQTLENLSLYFALNELAVRKILDFLEAVGLVQKRGTRFTTNNPYLHLGDNSPFLTSHLRNWRQKATEDLIHISKDSLQYSAVFSVSKKDYPKLKECLSRALEDCSDIIKPSNEEELCYISLDLASLKRNK